jgi:hypothetical protein
MKHYHVRLNNCDTTEFLIAAEDVEVAHTIALRLQIAAGNVDQPETTDAAIIQLRQDRSNDMCIAEVEENVWEEEKTKREVT